MKTPPDNTTVDWDEDDDDSATISIAKMSSKSIISSIKDSGWLPKKVVREINKVGGAAATNGFEELLDQELDDPSLRSIDITTSNDTMGLDMRDGKLMMVTQDNEAVSELDETCHEEAIDSDDVSVISSQSLAGDAATDDGSVNSSHMMMVSEDDLSVGSSVVTVETATSYSTRPPPKEVIAPGGCWTTRKYHGGKSLLGFVLGCLCCGVVGPKVLCCCPCDERDEYHVDGDGYCIARIREFRTKRQQAVSKQENYAG